MTVTTSPLPPVSDLSADPEPTPAADLVSESLPDPLSPGVAALIGVAALALSAVCTALMLTFSATTMDPLTAPTLLSVLPTGL